jgi:hypothetical protein
MSSFSRLIRFEAADSDKVYYADLGAETIESPASGSKIEAYKTFNELTSGKDSVDVTVGKVDHLNDVVLAESFVDHRIAARTTSFHWSAHLLRRHELQNPCRGGEGKTSTSTSSLGFIDV